MSFLKNMTDFKSNLQIEKDFKAQLGEKQASTPKPQKPSKRQKNPYNQKQL